MTDTETKIKTAIKDLIPKEGKFEVTVQEIAEKSEISRLWCIIISGLKANFCHSSPNIFSMI